MVSAIGPRSLSKAAVAIGGLLIFVGVIIVGLLALVLTRLSDTGALERMLVEYRMLFLGTLLAIGVLDVVSGIILRHR